MRSIWFSVDTLQCKSVTKSFRKLFSSLHTLSTVPLHCYTCSHHNTLHKLRPVMLPLADNTYYALLPSPAAPLLKILKQNPLYCSLLTCHTSWGLLCTPLHTAMYYALLFRGDRSFVESLWQHLLKIYLRCAYGYYTYNNTKYVLETVFGNYWSLILQRVGFKRMALDPRGFTIKYLLLQI